MCLLYVAHEASSQPRNVRVLNVQATSADVTWKVPHKPNGRVKDLKYEIVVQNGSFSYPKMVASNGIATTKITVTGLTQLTRYRVWIVAINKRKDGKMLQSPPSQVVNFTTKRGRKCKPEYIVHKRFKLP